MYVGHLHDLHSSKSSNQPTFTNTNIFKEMIEKPLSSILYVLNIRVWRRTLLIPWWGNLLWTFIVKSRGKVSRILHHQKHLSIPVLYQQLLPLYSSRTFPISQCRYEDLPVYLLSGFRVIRRERDCDPASQTGCPEKKKKRKKMLGNSGSTAR